MKKLIVVSVISVFFIFYSIISSYGNHGRGGFDTEILSMDLRGAIVSPNGCDQEIFRASPDAIFTSSTCLIELQSTRCEGSNNNTGRCSASAVVAIDIENSRDVKYFDNLSSDPVTGTCYPMTQTQKIESSKQGIIDTRSTGEICVLPDEPELERVTVYLDLNGNGVVQPDSRRDVPIPLIMSSNGVVLEDQSGSVVMWTLEVRVNRIDMA